MLRHIKLSHNQRIAAVCSFSTLAVAGLIGGIYSLGAFADGNRTVNLPDTTVSNRDITWTFGDNSSLTLSAGTGMPDINTPAQGENNAFLFSIFYNKRGIL